MRKPGRGDVIIAQANLDKTVRVEVLEARIVNQVLQKRQLLQLPVALRQPGETGNRIIVDAQRFGTQRAAHQKSQSLIAESVFAEVELVEQTIGRNQLDKRVAQLADCEVELVQMRQSILK